MKILIPYDGARRAAEAKCPVQITGSSFVNREPNAAGKTLPPPPAAILKAL